MGVTVENEDVLFRTEYLKEIPAQLKFLSCEPLLGPLTTLDISGLDWVIVGGESGRKPRPMKEGWVVDIKKTVPKIPMFY
jgi:protein gp37